MPCLLEFSKVQSIIFKLSTVTFNGGAIVHIESPMQSLITVPFISILLLSAIVIPAPNSCV